MSNESLLPWETVTVKKIDERIVVLSHNEADITVPKKIIRGTIHVGDVLHITILNEEEKNNEHKKLAKSILNALFQQNEKKEGKKRESSE